MTNTAGKATENETQNADSQRPKYVESIPEFTATYTPDIISAIDADMKNKINIGKILFSKSIVLAPD